MKQRTELENNLREIVKIEIGRLDWIKILDEAIKARRTSWGTDVVREWRNASDEVYSALMAHATKAGIFESLESKLKRLNNEMAKKNAKKEKAVQRTPQS